MSALEIPSQDGPAGSPPLCNPPAPLVRRPLPAPEAALAAALRELRLERLPRRLHLGAGGRKRTTEPPEPGYVETGFTDHILLTHALGKKTVAKMSQSSIHILLGHCLGLHTVEVFLDIFFRKPSNLKKIFIYLDICSRHWQSKIT